MKKLSLILFSVVLVSSCVSKKDFVALQVDKNNTQKELVNVKSSLQKCIIEKEKEILTLEERVKYLQDDKKNALKQVENLTVLTQSSSDNIKTVIAQLSEKDKYINGVREAMTQKDSLNLAIKYHLDSKLNRWNSRQRH